MVGLFSTVDIRTGVDRAASVPSPVVLPPCTVYIASTFESQSRLRPMRAALVELGYLVTSTWLDEETTAPPDPSKALSTPGLTEEVAYGYAIRDLREILEANMLIVDTLETNPRGGREYESGFAHANGRTIFVVGPVRNVFHTLHKRFGNWDEALTYFKEKRHGGTA